MIAIIQYICFMARSKREYEMQCAFHAWMEFQHPKAPHFSVVNEQMFGGKGGAIVGAKLKRSGRKSGVADYQIPCANNKYIGLWLEFKTPKGRVSDSQLAFGELMKSYGHRYEVVRSVESAIEIVNEYLSTSDSYKKNREA